MLDGVWVLGCETCGVRTFGVDRDSAELAHLFDERNLAVTRSIQHLITAAQDSISVTPDSFLTVKQNVAAAEHQSRG